MHALLKSFHLRVKRSCVVAASTSIPVPQERDPHGLSPAVDGAAGLGSFIGEAARPIGRLNEAAGIVRNGRTLLFMVEAPLGFLMCIGGIIGVKGHEMLPRFGNRSQPRLGARRMGEQRSAAGRKDPRIRASGSIARQPHDHPVAHLLGKWHIGLDEKRARTCEAHPLARLGRHLLAFDKTDVEKWGVQLTQSIQELETIAFSDGMP
jgi:hypothetical protein